LPAQGPDVDPARVPEATGATIRRHRRRLAAGIGEVIRAFLDELMAAGWSEQEARNAKVDELGRSSEGG
jgi:ribosomal protein S19E (S16A)